MNKTGNIILIEPKLRDREILPILLKFIGINAFVCENVDEAFTILESGQKIDISGVVLSNETLEKQYVNFAEWISKRHPDIKLVATTCRSSDEEICETHNISFVLKPITDINVIAKALSDKM